MGFFRYDISSITPVKLCTIPMIVLFLSLLLVGMTYMQTGLPIKPGMEFTGGIGVTIVTSETSDQIKSTFADYPLVAVEEGINQGKYLKFDTMSDDKVLSLNKLIEGKYTDAKIDHIGSSFGKTLQDQALFALLMSFIGMSIVVFLIFRTFVPSAAVVISAFADMTMTAAVMNILGFQTLTGNNGSTSDADRLFGGLRYPPYLPGIETEGKIRR